MFYDYCEAGRFSAFIDEEMNMLPCSFMIGSVENMSLRNTSMLEIWQESSVFTNFRNALLNRKCNCNLWNFCHRGCHVFDINLCDEEIKT
jgi:radical SAM protein with 4Fe4S-binding SPASM domain